MHKICFIYCYFGPLPWYFKYFLHSCKYNSTVNFILFTDAEISEELPPNFKVVSITLKDLRQLIDHKIQIKTNFTDAYKLCDFKPVYGDIFSDYLNGYDFWGHGDIDLIFGDIRSFFTPQILNENDVICVRREYVTGFLTVYKNNETINRLYRESRDYRKILEDAEHYCFDECGSTFYELMCGKSIFETSAQIESMTHIVKKFENAGKIKAHFEMCCVEDLPGKMEWIDGKLFFTKTSGLNSTKIDWNNGSLHNERKEVILYHLIKFKKLKYFYIPKWKEIPKKFFIHKRSFSTFHYSSVIGRLSNFLLDKRSDFGVEMEFMSKWLPAVFRTGNQKRKNAIHKYRLEDTEDDEFITVEFNNRGVFCEMGNAQSVGRKSRCYCISASKYISLIYRIEIEFQDVHTVICREPSQTSPSWPQIFLFEH